MILDDGSDALAFGKLGFAWTIDRLRASRERILSAGGDLIPVAGDDFDARFRRACLFISLGK